MIITKPHLSIVIPMLNEQDVVELIIANLSAQLATVNNDITFEFICVDDGSHDDTLVRLKAIAEDNRRVQYYALTRNFGKEAAILAGLERARGDAVVVIDADLQHPPSCLLRMIDLWRNGYEIVHGVKRTRAKEPFLHRKLASVFNLLMEAGTGLHMRGSSDFKLLDRVVVDVLLHLPERNRFFRGLVAWAGFRSTQVEFDVQERAAGTSKWSTVRLVRYALRNLVSFSTFPLTLTASTGLIAFLLGVSFIPWTLYRYLRGDAVTGFTTVILLQLVVGGILLTALGVISLYLGEILREIKGRPTFLLRPDQDRSSVEPVQKRECAPQSQQPPSVDHGDGQ